MTTTVAKGANRPAAAAKRERAAQRTPATPATRKTTPAPTRKPAGKATPGALPEDFKGAAKIQHLLDGAAEHGWTATLSDADAATGAATVACARGTGADAESIRSEFIDGKSAGYSFLTQPSGKVRRLNNVSAVLHVMAGLAPRTARRSRLRLRPTRPRRHPRPPSRPVARGALAGPPRRTPPGGATTPTPARPVTTRSAPVSTTGGGAPMSTRRRCGRVPPRRPPPTRPSRCRRANPAGS